MIQADKGRGGHYTYGTQGQELIERGAREASLGLVGWWESLYLSQRIKEDENSSVNQTRG